MGPAHQLVSCHSSLLKSSSGISTLKTSWRVPARIVPLSFIPGPAGVIAPWRDFWLQSGSLWLPIKLLLVPTFVNLSPVKPSDSNMVSLRGCVSTLAHFLPLPNYHLLKWLLNTCYNMFPACIVSWGMKSVTPHSGRIFHLPLCSLHFRTTNPINSHQPYTDEQSAAWLSSNVVTTSCSLPQPGERSQCCLEKECKLDKIGYCRWIKL